MIIQEYYACSVSKGHVNDTVLAVALSRSSIASLLYRVRYANDLSCYDELLAKWTERLMFKSWDNTYSIAKLSLDAYLNDMCTNCKGRGTVYLELSSEYCNRCNATGRAIGAKKEVVREAITILENIDRDASVNAYLRLCRD